MNSAQSLEDAIKVLEPKAPLRVDQMSKYYVERRGNPTNRLSVVLTNENGPTKIVFTGHRGSGKSTELNRLSALLEKRFFVVTYTAEGNLDLNDLDHVQILFSLALALWQSASDKGIKLKAADLNEIRDLISIISETEETESKQGIETEVGLNFQIAKISSRLKAEPATRRSLTKKIEPQISDLLSSIEKIIRLIQNKAKKEVVIIIDGLDKPSLDIAKKLFIYHGESLFSICCKVVFTVPLSLLYANEFNQIRHNVSGAFVLPNIPIKTEDGRNDRLGHKILKELLEKRIDPDLISRPSVQLLIDSSGGVVRELVMFTQGACVCAVASNRRKVIVSDVYEVIEEAKSNYRRVLRDSHYRELTEISNMGRFRNSEIAQELLHNLSLLEYQSSSGKTWFSLHPIVSALIEEGQVIEG